MIGNDLRIQRWLVLGLVIATTAVAATRLLAIFRVDGLSPAEWLVLALFALLFSWIAASFWVACLGAYELLRQPKRARAAPANPAGRASRTVLTIPIYNEDSTQLLARVQAMQESLSTTDAAEHFDFFILSDSTDPQRVWAEQAAWRELRHRNPDARIYYRHRSPNAGRKSGNIAEFCRNWGALYNYMVVLDADSLMTARTLVELVALMDNNPRSALIQVAPLLVGGESLFARSQQFASWVYGPVYAAGLARLQGADGNYWGHNAIIRVRPFMQHCGLPVLPGRPPFGGEIMSHDFVEAALLRRAGWDVWMASHLDGSYEATPPTLIDHLKRDQRWCQGNLQHTSLLFARGFPTQSRMHMAFGVMSYLSSPLWLMLIVLFFADAIRLQEKPAVTYHGRYPILEWPVSHSLAFISLVVATAILLYGPKLISAAVLLRNPETVRRFGGMRAILCSMFVETVLSTLLAPVYMVSHTWFVANALFGRSVGWGPQRRSGSGIGLGASLTRFAPHTLIAVLGGLLAWYWTPGSIWWYAPLLSGLLISSLLCWLTSSPGLGQAARRGGIFVVPSESVHLPILERVDSVLAEIHASGDPPRCDGDAALQAA